MSDYVCIPAKGPLGATVHLPGSKSITNRALVTAALADGTSLLSHALFADDTRLMIKALRDLGVAITVDEPSGLIEVSGCGGHLPNHEAELHCGNAGTVLRFLTAVCALGYGRFRLDGTPRMRQRPVGALADALQRLGAGIEFHENEGFPPFTVHAHGICGGQLDFAALESSQFITALLLSAPHASGDVLMEVPYDVPSGPYLSMTLAVMESFGVTVLADPPTPRPNFADRDFGYDQRREFPLGECQPHVECSRPPQRFIVAAPQRYQGARYAIEPDASSATYFLAAAAIAGGSMTVPGLGTHSIQGDAAFVDLLEAMGCQVSREPRQFRVEGPPVGQRLRALNADLNALPDAVPTLAVLALFCDGTTTIRNVGHLRVKESDRLTALRCELTKLGAHVEERSDELIIDPPASLCPAAIDTHDDHRMAMSFALAGLRCPGLTIRNPECCGKSFPDFFAEFEKATRSTR